MKQDDINTPEVNPHTTKLLLVAGYAAVIIILIIIASLGLRSMSVVSNKLTLSINEDNQRSKYGYEMRNSARMRTMLLHQMIRTDDPFLRDELFLQLRENGEIFLRARTKIISLGLDQKSQELLDLQREASTIAGALQYEVIDLLHDEKKDEAIDILFDKVTPSQNRAIEIIDQFINLQQQQSILSQQKTSEDFSRAYQVIITLTIIGILLGAIVSVSILRRTNHMIQALYNSELREKVIRENIVDAVVTFNSKGIITSSNKAIMDIFGYMPEEITGQHIAKLIFSDKNSDCIDSDISQLAHFINSNQQLTGQHKNGSKVILHVGLSKVDINGRLLYISVINDISEQIKTQQSLRDLNEQLELRVEARTKELQQANEKLKYLASHDIITDLPNRALLNEHLSHILASANRLNKKIAIFFLDIDGFKQINDTYGHDIGDILLKQISEKISLALRQSDLVARVGGDEFIVVLDDATSKPCLEAIALKIIESLSHPFIISRYECNIGVSIGISTYPQDGVDIETLIKCADQAMYKIKSMGKNNLYFYEDMKTH